MNNNTRESLPLSSLKGIAVYTDGDLHAVAKLKLKLNDARASQEKRSSVSRPTVNGLAKIFAEFIDVCYPDYDHVFGVIAQHGLPLGSTIELDARCQQSHSADGCAAADG